MKDWAPRTKWIGGIAAALVGSLAWYGIKDVLDTREAALGDYEQAQLERRLQRTKLAEQIQAVNEACDRLQDIEERISVLESWKAEGGPRFGRQDGEALRKHLEGEINALSRELADIRAALAALRARMPPP